MYNIFKLMQHAHDRSLLILFLTHLQIFYNGFCNISIPPTLLSRENSYTPFHKVNFSKNKLSRPICYMATALISTISDR